MLLAFILVLFIPLLFLSFNHLDDAGAFFASPSLSSNRYSSSSPTEDEDDDAEEEVDDDMDEDNNNKSKQSRKAKKTQPGMR